MSETAISCYRCGRGGFRRSQQGHRVHHFPEGIWLCDTCTAQERVRLDPPPRCLCCPDPYMPDDFDGIMLAMHVQMDGIKEAIIALYEDKCIQRANTVWDRTRRLEDYLNDANSEHFLNESDSPEDPYNRLYEEVWNFIQVADLDATSVPGSVGAEERHSDDLNIITTLSHWRRNAHPNPLPEHLLEEEASTEASIRRYWLVKGLDADSAETAAALEIAEARARR